MCIIKRFIICIFLFGLCSSAYAAVPTQFIAKLYTEALGRAPDPSRWQAWVNYFNTYGCSQGTLAYAAQTFFLSPEYTNIRYGATPNVLNLYKGHSQPGAGPKRI